MILIEAGERTERAFDAKLLFATQLAARGHRVVLDDRTMPDHLERYQKYEAAPFLADLSMARPERVLLIGAESLAAETLMGLRAGAAQADTPIHLLGRFTDRQAAIGAQSKVAYAFGREPLLIDLAQMQGPALIANAISPLAAAPVATGPDHRIPQLFVVLPIEALDDPQTLPLLAAIDNLPGIRLSVILPGKGKERVKASRYAALNIFAYTELSPASFASIADLAAFFGEGIPGERMAAFALDLMCSGRVVIDCTSEGGFIAAGAPAVRGPGDLGALANHVHHTLLVNRAEIGRQTLASTWLERRSVEQIERSVGLEPRTAPSSAAAPRLLFLPTNGVGLGHARRCTLIAEALCGIDPDAGRPGFAVFPSCVPLVRAKDFDCLPLVQKSPDHREDFANDLLTYLRLSQVLQGGDRLVFDGGYVFDSVYRAILEKRLDATWIRRGLWQAGQTQGTALDRERAFARVIVPGEAFEELNGPLGEAKVLPVGPVVELSPVPDAEARGVLRADLATRIGRDFDELVVTMLGGGVAADRSAQSQALAVLAETRPDTLHLVVVWPGALVPPGLAGWRNTRLVQTRNALSLCLIADLVVSAAGYNSFHELLYHAVPTIFVPQMAVYMDDQERRARAASERGLSVTVLAHEVLLLEREVRAFLDGDRAAELRAALAALELPTPGTEAAARIILGEGRT